MLSSAAAVVATVFNSCAANFPNRKGTVRQEDVLPERGKVASPTIAQHVNPKFNPDPQVFCGICAKF